MYGEARNQPNEGQIAVAWVIRNRVVDGRYGEGVRGVCLKSKAFSCWNYNPNDKNLQKMQTTNAGLVQRNFVRLAFTAAQEDDPTKGSKHYCRIDVSPAWARGKVPVLTIEAHAFYNNIDD